jgi:glycolate oxidase FAD binding subunit
LPSASEPDSLGGLAQALREASAAGRTVSVDRGDGDVVVSTARLDRVLEHEAGDLTVVAEAGVRLSALNERLAGSGQRLALDPPGDPTLGAVVAANVSGPLRHRYGAPRDLLLGATVVLPDGTVASSGGKVVKNVAGYDLAKLFCGSRGTLGVVARVSFRLHPLPEARGTLVVPAETPAEAQRLAGAVLRSTLVPAAVDLLWPGRLALLFEGSARAVEEQVERARSFLAGEEAGEEVWEEARARQRAAGGRLAFAPGRLAEVLAGVPETLVRVAVGSAFVPEPVDVPVPEPLRVLTERVRAAFDPDRVLVG